MLLLLTASVFLGSALLQSIAGFGFSLFAVSALLMLDYPLPEAVVLSTFGSTIQRCIGVANLHRSADWRALSPLILIGIFVLPIGIWLLQSLSLQEKSFIGQVFGILLLTILTIRTFLKLKPKDKVHWSWGYLAAICSGILNGLANIGGPPLVLWIHAHRWTTEKKRVSTLLFTLPCVPFQFIFLYQVFGDLVPKTLFLGLFLIPTTVVGTFIGLAMGKKVSEKLLRLLSYNILMVLGIFLILKPFIGQLL
jgi:hypothetical protein